MRRRAHGVAVLAAFAIAPVSACEFDGLGHGDGPAAAIFAGAQPYQALNGLIDGIGDRAGIVALEVLPAEKPAPRRSFAGWAARKNASGGLGGALATPGDRHPAVAAPPAGDGQPTPAPGAPTISVPDTAPRGESRGSGSGRGRRSRSRR